MFCLSLSLSLYIYTIHILYTYIYIYNIHASTKLLPASCSLHELLWLNQCHQQRAGARAHLRLVVSFHASALEPM